jgi:hypothetical protein
MPLFQAKSGTAGSILAKDGERVVAYSLTPQGAKQLKSAGVRSGQKVPARVLASLVRTGNAHSPRLADAAGQSMLGFKEDEQTCLPRCELTGTTSDVHLVVYGEGSGTIAKLLGSEPRFLLQKVTTLSIPVSALSLAAVDRLETAQKVPMGTAAAATLRDWFRQDLEAGWEKLQRENGRRQAALPLDSGEDELPLGGAGAT